MTKKRDSKTKEFVMNIGTALNFDKRIRFLNHKVAIGEGKEKGNKREKQDAKTIFFLIWKTLPRGTVEELVHLLLEKESLRDIMKRGLVAYDL